MMLAGNYVNSRNDLMSGFWLSTTAVWCIRRLPTPHKVRAFIPLAPVASAGLP